MAADFYDRMSLLEVEENADLPGAIQMRFPVARNAEGDLTMVNDQGFQPLANLAVVARSAEGRPQCIFDGYVLSQKLHLETGAASSFIEVYGQDATWMMNLEEKAQEWANQSDGSVANAIYQEHGITPGPDNLTDDSAVHSEDGHTLMQRATDIQFLRMLARRDGKWCRVVCDEMPGERQGIFAKPDVGADPAMSLRPNGTEGANVSSLDFEWDVMRPSQVRARQAMFNDSAPEGASGGSSKSGLAALDERDLATFAGQPMITMLTTPVDSGGELTQRSQALLREASWFARCTGESDQASLQAILRVGQVVRVETVGSVHSGKYLVWSVRHKLSQRSHTMRFTLVRNAVGPEPGGGGSGLLGGLI